MSYDKSNAQYTVPIAESTQIEDSPSASPSRSKFLWGGRYMPRNNKMSPGQPQQSPSTANKSLISPRPKALDAKMYCDTQSSGLVGRINKYVEASAAKSRPITNRTYSRPGDFPIVNLEKSEISIKPRHTNGAAIAKIGVAAPLRLNNQASIRSAIFRTGKNYGDAAPITAPNNVGVAGTSGATSNGNGTTSRDDEPIVPSSGEYDANPTRSVLDALVEISRKRTHCDELDGDFMKKQKPEKSPIVSTQIIREPSPPPNQIAKRGRDRTSPSYHNNAAETQKKRYRNNDILSSLSSSMHLHSPKSVRTNLDFDFDAEKSNVAIVQDINSVKARPALRSEGVEMNGIDTPSKLSATLNNNNEIAPSKSHSSLQAAPKLHKLTLFNKIYEPTTATTTIDKSDDVKCDLDDSTSGDYEDNCISFVKPKTKTSTVFKVNKNETGMKSKLAIMLSYLSEGESRDEVDNGVPPDKKKINELPIAVASSTASLSTGDQTTVTFSTATTTSVLSLPSAVSTGTEKQKNGAFIAAPVTEVSGGATKPTSPIVATIATSNANNADALPKSMPLPTFSEPSKPKISFALNATTAASTTSLTTITATSSESEPRLGGFSFGATMTTPAPAIASKADLNLNASQPTQTKKQEDTIPTITPLPAFSFGKPAAAISTVSTPMAAAPASEATAKTIPAAGGFSFGASAPPKSTSFTTSFGVTATTASMNLPTTSAQSMAPFSFGKNLNGSPVPATMSAPTATPPSFGASSFGALPAGPSFGFTATTTTAAPSTGTAPSTTSMTSSTASTFNFTAPKPSGISFGAPSAAPTVTTSALGGSSTFTFGASSTVASPANPSPFGVANTNTATPNLFGAKIENTSAATLTTQTPSANLFGTPSAATPTTTASIPSFGGSFNRSTPTAPPAFGSSTAFNGSAATPVFGTFGANNNAPPAFGSSVSFGSPVVTAATQAPATNLFGSTTAGTSTKAEPVFGSSSAATAAPAFGTSSFGATNNLFGSSSQIQNPGGTSGLFGANNATASPSFAGAPPSFGGSATQIAQPAPATGVFAFGQTATPTTTASGGGGGGSIFGSTPTNTNSSFAFGQTANSTASSSTFAAPTNDTTTPFAFNAATNNSTVAQPAFGSSSSAFNFAAKIASPFGATASAPAAPETKSAFSFNAVPNANATNVSAFNSAPPNVSPFGTNSNAAVAAVANSSFSFGASTNEAAKPFSFGTGTTDNNSTNSNMFGAPAAAPSPFAFGGPPATGIASPPANAFQFNAQQPPATNLFSIGPGNSSTAPKNRPIRQATRRINK